MPGCAGHPALRHATPNIGRLAESGTFFENAYCSHPICCPSRANMWSGRYTHDCESWNNYKGLEPGKKQWSVESEGSVWWEVGGRLEGGKRGNR